MDNGCEVDIISDEVDEWALQAVALIREVWMELSCASGAHLGS